MTFARTTIGPAKTLTLADHGGADGDDELRVPLAVDLDGALVASDLALESLLLLAKRQPLAVLQLPFWLADGRAQLKHRLAAAAMPDVRTLPYNEALLEYLREEKRRGRRIVLATAAAGAVAQAVAQYLGLFDAVYASDGATNLAGERKCARLTAEFGAGGFDYVGTSGCDRPVWAAARKAIVVAPPAAIARLKRGLGPIERAFPTPGFGIIPLSSALRAHHWLKNLLILLPLVAEHRLYDLAALSHAFIAFVAFSLCASSVYLLNDLLDLPHDRLHPGKKQRMLASGRLSIAGAVMLIGPLLAAAAGLSLMRSGALFAVVAGYWVLMMGYCFRLRDVLVLDVLALAGGYTLRATAGAVAAGVAIDPWLLAFCMLFFFGLALLKRYAELVTMRSIGRGEARAYLARHSDLVLLAGCGSGYLALGVLAYELGLDHRTGGRYALAWLLLPLLLYWLTHIWAMARGGSIVSDPVAFAIADSRSRIVAALAAAALLVSA